MRFIELLFLPLIVSAACALALIGIGIYKRSTGRIALGIAQLSIFAPLAVLFLPGGYRDAVTIALLVLVGCAVTLVIQWRVYRAGAEIMIGVVGVTAFGAYVFLLANAP